jgi:hypothetical protein
MHRDNVSGDQMVAKSNVLRQKGKLRSSKEICSVCMRECKTQQKRETICNPIATKLQC